MTLYRAIVKTDATWLPPLFVRSTDEQSAAQIALAVAEKDPDGGSAEVEVEAIDDALLPTDARVIDEVDYQAHLSEPAAAAEPENEYNVSALEVLEGLDQPRQRPKGYVASTPNYPTTTAKPGIAWRVMRPLIHLMDPESAHRATITILERLPTRRPRLCDPSLAVTAFGLDFPNPLGLAAGFDKDARVPDAMLALGFGFVEVGSITPKPQVGNERPRMFRLPKDLAVINRLGFNNEGAGAATDRLEARGHRPGAVGVNIGANKQTSDKAADYVEGVRTFAPFASFFTINVSSPNTEGLRKLQAKAALDNLVVRVIEERNAAAGRGWPRRPVILKIAPDLTLGELDDVVAVATRRGLDGLVVGNTTIARPKSLKGTTFMREAGGLSGSPLFQRSTWLLAETYRRIGTSMPIVAAGGVASTQDMLVKIRAGATLVELYTALVYEGPSLPRRILDGLAGRLRELDLDGIQPLIGADAEDIAALGPGD